MNRVPFSTYISPSRLPPVFDTGELSWICTDLIAIGVQVVNAHLLSRPFAHTGLSFSY